MQRKNKKRNGETIPSAKPILLLLVITEKRKEITRKNKEADQALTKKHVIQQLVKTVEETRKRKSTN